MMNLRRRLQCRLGFTLIEAMIVIAIVAIMSAIAIPYYGGFIDNRDLKSAARDIAGDIFEMKERAIAEDRYYQITFNQGASSYTMHQCAVGDTQLPCITGTDIITKSPSAFKNDIVISAVNLPAGNVIQLLPRGIINPAGNANGNITLRNSRGSRATITISLTGRASVDWTGTIQ